MTPDDLPLLSVPSAPAVLPDGSAAVVAVTHPDLETDEYTGQLWLVPLVGDAAPHRITRGHRDTAPDVSPDGRWVAFCRAEPRGKPQLYVVEATGGEPVRLTDAPLGVSAPRFSPDGRRIAYLARVPEEGRYVAGGDPAGEPARHITSFRYRGDGVGFERDKRQHVFVVQVPTADGAPAQLARVTEVPESTALTRGDAEVRGARWLPSGDALVAVVPRHADREEDLRRDAVLVPAGSSAVDVLDLVPVTDADRGSTLGVEAVLPSADGTSVWLLATDLGASGHDFVAAQVGLFRAALPVAGQEPAVPVRLTDADAVDLDAGVLAESPDGPLVAVQHRGAVHLARVTDDGALVTLLGDRHVVSGAAVASGAVPFAVVTAAHPTSAGDVLTVPLDGSGAAAPRTDLSAPLRGAGVREPREVEATAPDGYPVHGWVVTPDPERHGPGPYPTILMIHGGPHAQYTHAVFDEVQVLAAAGWAVVLGNPRGSSGYGRAHGRAIHRAFGTVDTDDVLALLDAAATLPEVDADRVGVMGGSYGGYLTAWLTTRTDRFAAAVVERGFLDPVSFVGSSDIGWFFGLEYLGDAADEDGARAVAAQSPMAHVGAVRTPTLVIHSEQDWRCPVEQGQRWFVELRRRGVEAELLLFPGEGHELTRSGRPRHRRQRFEHVLAWWGRHLPTS
ncbi:S9 family peptidase [Cellulomonas sp. H30R-01]|uniref:S9 family peptidase n=1 Tax=Cellulomonas sp. H30R-01 TaxID=2704467 RepID=UPI00138C31D5|nr:S9 family peptidase [Cellulomonas sp. H30R-01]QHT55465.1 S9 family peptidase [Cellulomonas sp. H30R-01]